jgi:Protein of unknown function (DUF2868).
MSAEAFRNDSSGPPAGGPRPGLAARKRIDLGERLLAEAVRLHEDAQGFVTDEPRADAAAQTAGGDLEQRVIIRAQSLPIASSVADALRQLRGTFGLVVALALILAALAGSVTAHTALSIQEHEPVNFFWVFGSVLGVPSIALLAWLIVVFVKPGTASARSLGRGAFALTRRLTQWLHRGPAHLAAVQGTATVLARSDIGRWMLGAISHGLWLSFLVGCLMAVVFLLGTRHYTFGWETTILSERAYVPLTRALAIAPQAMGFPTPSTQQIKASQWTGQGDLPVASREAWSGLLLGSIVVYGLMPRALCLLVCVVLGWRACARFRLDLTLPGYARLEARLLPVSTSLGVIDTDDNRETEQAGESVMAPLPLWPVPSQGPVAIMGLETDRPASTWPPRLTRVEWLDLGFVDSGNERLRALEQIKSAVTAPRLIVVVCSLALTPDRGIRAFIGELQQSTHIPVVLVLTEGQRLRARAYGDQVAERIEDWHLLARAASVSPDRIIEVDLDHLTDASRSKLSALIGARSDARAPMRRIEQSFRLILEHATRWSGVPDVTAQAELHRAIAALYSGEDASWQTLFRSQVNAGANLLDRLQSSADRVVNLLPEKLRSRPKWLAAGAMAGAMACVAAATVISPAAIASLPVWAGLGAALALIVPLKYSEHSAAPLKPAQDYLTHPVTSAALFAVLLELQGRDEVTITRLLEHIAGEEDPSLDSIDAARQWLREMRVRFEHALAAERSS